jgi:hypothetical protein
LPAPSPDLVYEPVSERGSSPCCSEYAARADMISGVSKASLRRWVVSKNWVGCCVFVSKCIHVKAFGKPLAVYGISPNSNIHWRPSKRALRIVALQRDHQASTSAVYHVVPLRLGMPPTVVREGSCDAWTARERLSEGLEDQNEGRS